MKRTLERNLDQAILGGVMAGLAEYFNEDPVLFRLGAVIILIITGIFPGLVFYIAAWLMIPRKRTGEKHADYDIS